MQNRTYDKEKISFTLARLKKSGENFEIVISDVDNAIKYREGKEISLNDFLQSQTIFENASKGIKASEEKINSILKDNPIEMILKQGELHLTSEQRQKMSEDKRNKIIEKIQRDSVDPKTGNPHPRQRIELAMEQAKIKIDYSDNIDKKMEQVILEIRKIIPISFEKVRIKITIPSKYTGSTYSAIRNRFNKLNSEEWLNNGDLKIELEVTGGQKTDLYNLINKLTNGDATIEE